MAQSLQKGDKVKVLDFSDSRIEPVYFEDGMFDLIGQTLTIKEIILDAFKVEENDYLWHSNIIEKISEFTYLAIPYTFNPQKSFAIANEVAAILMKKGKTVFSPISHSHPIADCMNPEDRLNQKLWMNQDLPILSKCDSITLVVIGKKGHDLIQKSSGCQSEILTANIQQIPIKYYYYD